MKVALLCPGPSLPDTWCDDFFDGFDVVIGVNTAAWKYKVHWLVGADKHVMMPVLKGQYPAPLRGVVSSKFWGSMARDMGIEWKRPPLQNKETVKAACPVAPQTAKNDVCAYSFPQALWLAYEFAQSPSEIEIHGFDCAQQKQDFAGVNGDHSKNRWIFELSWLRDIWKPGIVNNGKASAEVMAYLEGRQNQNPFA